MMQNWVKEGPHPNPPLAKGRGPETGISEKPPLTKGGLGGVLVWNEEGPHPNPPLAKGRGPETGISEKPPLTKGGLGGVLVWNERDPTLTLPLPRGGDRKPEFLKSPPLVRGGWGGFFPELPGFCCVFAPCLSCQWGLGLGYRRRSPKFPPLFPGFEGSVRQI